MASGNKISTGNAGEYFVAGELEPPEYHIVPSKILAETIKQSYQEWLNTPGKKGQAHNDTNIRNFTDYDDIYLNRWDFLGK